MAQGERFRQTVRPSAAHPLLRNSCLALSRSTHERRASIPDSIMCILSWQVGNVNGDFGEALAISGLFW
jgi:hypothetical protein